MNLSTLRPMSAGLRLAADGMTIPRLSLPLLGALLLAVVVCLGTVGCDPGGGGSTGTTGGDAAGSPSSGEDPNPDAGEDGDGDGNSTVRERPEISSLDPAGAEIAALREGVRVMKQRDVSDPTSWMYQANIHGAFASSGDATAWRTCQHRSFYFLSWHRMYLYYFERILREASGDPAFALPYWDYELPEPEARALPVVFREPATADNPLFVADRRSGINNGALVPESWVDASETLLEPIFTAAASGDDSFGGVFMAQPAHFGVGSGALELQPHNNLHNAVGGLMSDPDTAAQDPIFWLHHCNIDRLWEKWLQDPSHENPVDDDVWLDTEFTFFDETGTEVVLTGRQILDTATQLDYRYSGLEPGQGGTPDDVGDPLPETPQPETPFSPRVIAESESQAYALGAEPLSVDVDFTGSEAPFDSADLELVIEGLELASHGDVYQVYLNLPAGEEPTPASPHFVGNLSIFAHVGHSPPENRRYDVGELAQRLEASGAFAEGLQLTIVRGTLEPPPGEESILEGPVSTAPRITFDRVRLQVKP